MAVFDGVRYSFPPSLPQTRRDELASVLDLNGAAPHPPYTHVIVLPASHVHSEATNDPTVKLVTDRWVDRGVVLGKCQPEQYYSPDPAMIFSGVVACATDLSVADLEVLSAGITALGGQWRIGLTRDVTHLFALRPGSDKYNTALHFAPQTHMCILTPHWFDDTVRLGRRIPETPYAWPDPPVLRPGMSLNLDDDAPAADGKRRRKSATDRDTDADNGKNAQYHAEHSCVWADRRILLSSSLELGERSRGAIEAGIRRAGGLIVSIPEDADEDVEEKAVDECDVFVTRWRCGKAYFKAARASLLIGTLSWLFSVESSGTLHSPLDSLLWYPTPRGGIPGLIDCEISVTNYTGAARDYLKRLIVLVGAKFTPSMSQSNMVLLAGFQPSPKTTRALSWSIPVVNHSWLEDCIVEWRALTVGLERYIVYPPGVDFGQILLTRHDEVPTSHSTSTQRLSGGAVPGGRGIDIVDLEQDEIRDAEYRASVVEAGGPDIGTSTSRLESNAQTGSRARAESVKRTPSMPGRKRRSTSTPVTTSAMGTFVDHVIEIPADDDDVGDPRTPVNGKQHAQATAARSRATPRIVSRASSVGLFSTANEVEAGVPPSGGNSREDKGKSKEDGRDDAERRRMRPAEEIARKECPPRSRRRLVQNMRETEHAQSDDESAPAPGDESRGRVAKRITMGSDSDASRGRVLEVSVPPRKPIRSGSKTPVRSGMKPRPRSRSMSTYGSVLGGESEGEMRKMAVDSGIATATEVTRVREQVLKPTYKTGVVNKDKERAKDKDKNSRAKERNKEKEKERASEKIKETTKTTPRHRSRTRSPLPVPSSPSSKHPRTPKRRLSVLVPSVPEDYFPSQGTREGESEEERNRERQGETGGVDVHATSGRKQVAPATSVQAVSAEASTSTSKRGRPVRPSAALSESQREKKTIEAKSKSKPTPKVKAKPDVTKAHVKDGDGNVDHVDEEGSSTVDLPLTSSGRGGPRRNAANKASTRLKEKIMPDVISFEKERKQAKRKRNEDRESVVSVRGRGGGERKERSVKRRKVPREEEEEEEAEVEEVVLVPGAKPTITNGKKKAKRRAATGFEDETDDSMAMIKLSGSQEKKGGHWPGKESAAIRLMTTGVSLMDDVIKRITRLGVQMTTKPTECTHLVAKGIVRTEKFLCAMSVAPYILTEEWANASAKVGKLLPENNYLLSDEAAEQKWAFKFADALERARGPDGGSNLFKHMTFYVTPKVGVDVKLLRNVVTAGGGQVQTSTTPTVRILKGKVHRYVVSCEEDKGIWRPLVQEGFKVYSPELVLRGALRQEVEWENEVCLVVG